MHSPSPFKERGTKGVRLIINILITGGARSGKSRFAQELALKLGESVLFVATAVAGDQEMRQRISELEQSETEWLRTENALRSSEEKFFKAFHSSPAIMAISALEDGRFIEVNESFLRSTGYSREEVIGHTSTELKQFASSESRERLIQTLQEQGSLHSVKTSIRTKTGCIVEYPRELPTCIFTATVFPSTRSSNSSFLSSLSKRAGSVRSLSIAFGIAEAKSTSCDVVIVTSPPSGPKVTFRKCGHRSRSIGAWGWVDTVGVPACGRVP